MDSATIDTLNNAGKFAEHIRSVLEGKEEPELLQEVLSTTLQDEDNGREVLRVESSPMVKAGLSDQASPNLPTSKLPVGLVKNSIPKMSAGGGPQSEFAQTQSILSLPGSPTTSEAPPAEDSVHEGTPSALEKIPGSEIEALEMYLTEKYDKQISEITRSSVETIEVRFAEMVGLVTRLQRRVEILEQRSSVGIPPIKHLRQPSDKQVMGSSSKLMISPHSDIKQDFNLNSLVRELLSSHRTEPPPFAKRIFLQGLLKKYGSQGLVSMEESNSVVWTETEVFNLLLRKG